VNKKVAGYRKALYGVLVLALVFFAVTKLSTVVTLAKGAEYTDPFTSTQEAALYLRQGLMNREAEISFWVTLPSGDQDDVVAYMSEIWNKSLEHDKTCPTAGDYLESNRGTVDMGASWYTNPLVGNFTYTVPGVRSNPPVDYLSTKAQEDEVKQVLDAAVADLNLEGKSEYYKVKAIYDYVRLNVTYDKSLTDHSTYSAAVKRKSVCQGYSSMLYYMMLKAGIDCRIITGQGNGGAHGWNIVKIGDTWYNVDVTWDSDQGSDRYFLLSDATFNTLGGGHTRDAKYLTEEFVSAHPITTVDNPFKDDEGLDGVVLRGCGVRISTYINVYYNFAIPNYDNDMRVKFTFPDDAAGTYTQTAICTETGKYTDGTSYYQFECMVPSSRLTDAVEAQVISGDKKSEVYRVSVQKYANVILNHKPDDPTDDPSAEEREILIALLTYGAYSQKYTGYKTDKLANVGLTDPIPTLNVPIDFQYFGDPFTAPEKKNGIEYYASSLLLRSQNSLRYYFVLDDMSELNQYSFYCNGTSDAYKLTPVVKGNYVYVEVSGIPYNRLNNMCHIYVKKNGAAVFDFKYNPMNYIKIALTKYAAQDPAVSENLANNMKALYLYFRMTNKYASGGDATHQWDQTYPITLN
jgi:hypothetical protein